MGIFQELAKQYDLIDNAYAAEEFRAKRYGWLKKEAAFQRKRLFNDQAYFLFMFTRLEARITLEASNLIRRKRATQASWRAKAPWTTMDSDAGKIHFKARLALLTEKGRRDYELVCRYYEERNSLAHGGGFTTSISIPSVTPDFIRLDRCLRG
jgi:hypothetical protein